MKTITLLFISLLTYASSSETYLNELKASSSILGKAMDIDGVKQIYNSCFDYYQNQNNGVIEANKIMNCVWSGNINANISGVSQSKELSRQVNDLIKTDSKGNEVQDSRFVNEGQQKERKYETGEHTEAVTKLEEENKAFTALKKYYNEKLLETLYGKKIENSKEKLIKTERTVDQLTFYKLHKSQLGKNIINSLSSYCIEARIVDDMPFIENSISLRKKTKKSNLENLSKLTNGKEGKTIRASRDWNVCISNLQHICNQPSKYEEYDEQGNKTGRTANYSESSLIAKCESSNGRLKKEDCEETVRYSQRRACTVTQYLSEARKNMIALDETIDKYSDLKISDRAPANSPKFYKDQEGLKSIDELTSLTSSEVIESEYAQKNQEDIQRLDECIQSPSEEKCENFLKNDRDEQIEELAEIKLKQEANLQRLKEIDSDDKASIANLLISEGYTEEDAKKMAEMDNIKDQIEERYSAQKDAIIANLSEKIDKLTMNGEKIDLTTGSKDFEKLQKLKTELESKSEDFAQLVHYNNLISGYLNIQDDEGNKTRNTASIKRELEGNAFSSESLEKNKDLGIKKSFNNDYDTYANQVLNQTGIPLDAEESDDSDTKDLSVGQINDFILNYFSKKQSD